LFSNSDVRAANLRTYLKVRSKREKYIKCVIKNGNLLKNARFPNGENGNLANQL